MASDLDVALSAARAGAAIVRAGFDSLPAVRMKGEVDPVTQVDDDAERAVFDAISSHRPDDDLLGEESGGSSWDGARVWIVDPLDGTVNFVHGVPHVAVSVALWQRGRASVGVVIDVMRAEEFAAVAGGGVWLDGEPISVSTQLDLGESLVVTGFPYDRRQRAAAYARVVGAVLAEVQGLRRFGSAALDFAWVACGRFDAYWEYGLGPWDAAAGKLLVTEAGGQVSDHTGGEYTLGSPAVAASNKILHDQLTTVLSRHVPEHLR